MIVVACMSTSKLYVYSCRCELITVHKVELALRWDVPILSVPLPLHLIIYGYEPKCDRRTIKLNELIQSTSAVCYEYGVPDGMLHTHMTRGQSQECNTVGNPKKLQAFGKQHVKLYV